MRDIATATLSGNLTRDVELRQLPSGADVARLRVATTTRRRNRRGMGRQDQLLHRRGVRRPGARLRPVPGQGLARARRRRARLARMDRPAEQQARSGHLQSPPSALRRHPARPDPRRQRRQRAHARRCARARCGHPIARGHTLSGADGGQHGRAGERRRPAVLMSDGAPQVDDRTARRVTRRPGAALPANPRAAGIERHAPRRPQHR